jgi:hypothetical protein
MAIEQTRAQVIANIWQAIAQSDVDLSSVPHDQQEKLVAEIADNIMLGMNAMMDEQELGLASEIETGEDELILWTGRPFLSMVETYAITSERIKIIKGLFSRDLENYELIRIQDIDLSQGVNERILNIGDLTIQGHDPSDPTVILRNISKPEEVYEIMRRAWLEARKRHGLQFREFM